MRRVKGVGGRLGIGTVRVGGNWVPREGGRREGGEGREREI